MIFKSAFSWGGNMLVAWRVMLYENDVRIFQPTNFLQVVWSSASFRLIAESKRALTSVKNCRFDLLSIGIKCGENQVPGTLRQTKHSNGK